MARDEWMNDTTLSPDVEDLFNLAGRTILVTGASGNIGRGIAKRLAEAGAAIVVHYFSDEAGASETSNAVSPGLIDRDTLQQSWPEGVRSWQQHAPLKRLGQPDDVADAVLFLLSRASRWVSGVNLAVDGGMSSVSRW